MIKIAFGEEKAYKTPISSTKGATGHCLGASGAIEALACILAVRDDIVPPTINQETPDPECDLDYIPNESRKVPVEHGALEQLRLRRPQRVPRDQEVPRMTARWASFDCYGTLVDWNGGISRHARAPLARRRQRPSCSSATTRSSRGSSWTGAFPTARC